MKFSKYLFREIVVKLSALPLRSLGLCGLDVRRTLVCRDWILGPRILQVTLVDKRQTKVRRTSKPQRRRERRGSAEKISLG